MDQLSVKVSDRDFQIAVNRWFSVVGRCWDPQDFQFLIPSSSYSYSSSYYQFPNGITCRFYWCSKETAAKIDALNGPHYHAMVRAWLVKMGKPHGTVGL